VFDEMPRWKIYALRVIVMLLQVGHQASRKLALQFRTFYISKC
jgi:hypothetical protein